jgi:hypothetical protein
VDACPALLASAVKAVIMTDESGLPDDECTSSMPAAEQVRAAEEPEDGQHLRACIEEAYARLRYAPTPDQENALKELAADVGEPLALAKILRLGAHLLETWPLPDSDLVRKVRGLVQLSSADAIALVEGGQVPVDQAALVGHHVQRSFVHDHPSGVCEDFQLRAMRRLAEGKPVSAKFVAYFKNPIEEVANEVLNEQNAERRRLDCERIAAEPYWSVWHVLSWIAFRDLGRLCEIADEKSLRGLSLYGVKYYGSILKETRPETPLLGALRNGELKAVRNGAELPAMLWVDRYRVDRNTWFRKRSVRRCWPGPGEWNGFQDEFWSLGQMILWIVTRDPDEVDQASDDAGRVGPRSGYGGFAAAARLEELLREDREQIEDAANDLRRRCLRGELKALSGQAFIPAIAWIDLKIVFIEGGVPSIRHSCGNRVHDNIRFPREDALRVFRPERRELSSADPSRANVEPAQRVEVETPDADGGNIQLPAWIIPPNEPNRSRPSVLIAWKALRSIDSWKTDGIPAQLPSGLPRSIESLTQYINKIILPRIRDEIEYELLNKLRSPGVSETSVRRALGFKH